ncbi:MAG: hypothetical protein ACYSVY_19500 [Planctomycetota bacterium]|jgi:hypothetical protein
MRRSHILGRSLSPTLCALFIGFGLLLAAASAQAAQRAVLGELFTRDG